MSVTAPAGGAPLSIRLRESTKAMHRLAERSAFIGELLAGRLDAGAYCAYLRNLHALYDVLECELGRLARETPGLPWIVPALFRRDAIAADLARLGGADWPSLRVAATLRAYAGHLEVVSRDAPHRLAAHAYVRYLGDLSGGQAIGGVIRRAYALGDGPGAAFYDFGSAGDPTALKASLRAALDAYGETIGPVKCGEIAAEAVEAFERHRALFEELRGATNAA